MWSRASSITNGYVNLFKRFWHCCTMMWIDCVILDRIFSSPSGGQVRRPRSASSFACVQKNMTCVRFVLDRKYAIEILFKIVFFLLADHLCRVCASKYSETTGSHKKFKSIFPVTRLCATFPKGCEAIRMLVLELG